MSKELQEISRILSETPMCFIATMDGTQPRVRAFQFQFEQDGKLWFCTARNKDVFKQLLANPAVEIWPLDLGDLPVVEQHYDLIENPTELAERITSGGMYGACVEDRLAGFIGVHTEGAMGMLTVLRSIGGGELAARCSHIWSPEPAPGAIDPLQSDFSGEPGVYGAAEKSGDGASAGNHLVAAAEAVNGGMAQLQREQMRKLRDKSWKKNGQKAGDGVLFI